MPESCRDGNGVALNARRRSTAVEPVLPHQRRIDVAPAHTVGNQSLLSTEKARRVLGYRPVTVCPTNPLPPVTVTVLFTTEGPLERALGPEPCRTGRTQRSARDPSQPGTRRRSSEAGPPSPACTHVAHCP